MQLLWVLVLTVAFSDDKCPSEAPVATVLITSNKLCLLTVNAGDPDEVGPGKAHQQAVPPGEVLVRCEMDGRHDERVIMVGEGRQAVVQFSWPDADD